jgi:hypothetical protein
VAVAFRQAMGVLGFVRSHTVVVMALGGMLLVLVGVAEVTGWYQTWVIDLQHHFGAYTVGL